MMITFCYHCGHSYLWSDDFHFCIISRQNFIMLSVKLLWIMDLKQDIQRQYFRHGKDNIVVFDHYLCLSWTVHVSQFHIIKVYLQIIYYTMRRLKEVYLYKISRSTSQKLSHWIYAQCLIRQIHNKPIVSLIYLSAIIYKWDINVAVVAALCVSLRTHGVYLNSTDQIVHQLVAKQYCSTVLADVSFEVFFASFS